MTSATAKHSKDKQEHIGLMIFLLGNHYFAFNNHDVKELLSFSEITHVPGSSELFLGVVDIRGDIEAVIDLHKLLRIAKPEETGGKQRIMIIHKDEISCGILVDVVEDIVSLPQSEIQEAIMTLNESVSSLAMGQAPYKKDFAIILNIEQIFNRVRANQS